MRVFKFGGASVKDADAVRNVGEILRLFPEDKILVVVSAMGKTTNAMEEIAHHLYEKNYDEFRNLVAERKRFHLQIVDALFQEKNHPIFTQVKTIFNDLGNRVNVPSAENYNFEYDQIVSLGEVVSTKIVQAYIESLYHNSAWLDARKLVRTNHAYREAEVDWTKTERLITSAIDALADKKIFVTQGFLGHTDEGFTTTLGREGSDFTAGIFAYCLNAVDVTIWKDVPGMLNADPKWFDNTVKLDSISFREAIELAYYGASVIHPKTIKPLQNKQIPLFVKSFLNPEAEGTVIQSSMENDDLVPSFIFKMEQVLISVTPKDFSFIVEENLSRIFAVLSECNAKINIMQNSALSFSFCVDGKTNLSCLQEKLSGEFEVKINEGLELVTIRHYDAETIDRLTVGKEILLEQKTRQTARLVIKNVMAE
ncbi:aspartate kinase [Lishizhenia tianjinensis]|uniref:Aspartokinase n=1 Tax=Lishizhenia tianjinensis TaxID=477690 RepID=A0A1I6ZX20_9FLAO|nr:aspartate kinase [Lishizhenia tianjinensis]SFT67229.1 aspartate kinase [Lishizhenia tianjinensis]